MRSCDVVRVFDAVPVGTKIAIVDVPLCRAMTEWAVQHMNQGRRFAANGAGTPGTAGKISGSGQCRLAIIVEWTFADGSARKCRF